MLKKSVNLAEKFGFNGFENKNSNAGIRSGYCSVLSLALLC